MSKLLITGSTGFVGRYVVNAALKKGLEIYLLVRNPSKAKVLYGQSVRIYVVEDFTDKNNLLKILKEIDPEYVIHLIGIIQENRSKGVTFEKVHYEYSKQLYDLLKDFSPKKVVHMSALGVDEKAPSQYHITKLKAEKKLIESGLPYVILRPSFIIGPEQLLFIKLKPLLKRTPFLLFPDFGNYSFQPIDVRDVAESFVNALTYEKNAIFELCGDEKVKFNSLIRDFVKVLGKNVLFFPFPKMLLKIFAPQQYLMMWRDNICGYNESLTTEDILGRSPISYKESIKWSALF
ncbi:MAG: NAD-dependent epimerase/dehydratase family protein [Thermodesulfovibrio sp.]|nr:NAD-dependent epimerase/dehydratase family protein [Thermodesulfovibrio sp.]